MAYATMESQFGYETDLNRVRIQSRQKLNNNDYDAQVATQQAIYNEMIERDLDRYNHGRKPILSTKISSLHTIQAPQAAYLEQRSMSVDEGNQRKESVNNQFTYAAQQDALTRITGQMQQVQQQIVYAQTEEGNMEQMPQGQRQMVQEPEMQKYSDLPLRNHIAYQATKVLAPPQSGGLGLPASPRPIPNHRSASVPERKPSSALSFRNGSVDRPQDQACESLGGSSRKLSSDISPRNTSIDRTQNQASGSYSDTSRKPSSATSPRSGSVDRAGVHPYACYSDSSRKPSSAFSSRSNSRDKSGSRGRSHPAPFETPRNASDAGMKTIKVICDQITLKLCIIPTTTAMEILAMASVQLGEGFDQKRYILMESFKEVGSDRPIRYYERVRDVLKSWDNDEQNELLIQPFHTQWEYESLDLYNAPKIVPSDLSTALYYSHRPESWHKWTFTLKADGQILMQKYKGGDAKAICHMKDFDIYVPTTRQLKKLAAPRKFCFAIKSQQKSVQCENSSNFVHFFCTSEKDMASEWYRAVHGWRSHYLVHSIGLNEVAPISSRPSISSIVQRNPSLASQRKVSDGLQDISEAKRCTTFPSLYQNAEIKADSLNSCDGLPVSSYNRSGSVNNNQNCGRSGSIDSAQSYNRSGSVNTNQSFGRSGSTSSSQGYSRSGSLNSSRSSSRNPSQDHGTFQRPFPQSNSMERPHHMRKGSSSSAFSQEQYTQPILEERIHPSDTQVYTEPATFTEHTLSDHDYALRKESLASKYREEPFAEGSPLERVRPPPMRKDSSSSEKSRTLPYPSAWRKPSTGVLHEVKTPTRNPGNITPATAPSAFEWRFDPFTGQPLTRPDRKDSKDERKGMFNLRKESAVRQHYI